MGFRASQTTAAPEPASGVSLDFIRGSFFAKIKSHCSSIPFALSKDMLRSLPIYRPETRGTQKQPSKLAINPRSGHEQTLKPKSRITHPAHHEEEDEEFQTTGLDHPTNTLDEFTKTGSKQAHAYEEKQTKKVDKQGRGGGSSKKRGWLRMHLSLFSSIPSSRLRHFMVVRLGESPENLRCKEKKKAFPLPPSVDPLPTAPIPAP